MDAQDIINALLLGEDEDLEFKSAQGGLSASLWETYSAMANTDGGLIILGVREKEDHFELQGLAQPQKLEQDFWNQINNKSKVNLNLLTNRDVVIATVQDKSLLLIQVPRATRTQRPIYVGQNPLQGTFRRYNEGDYRCTPDEVGRMLADQSEQPADSRIVTGFDLNDLDRKSLEQYRNRFASRAPTHPWLNFGEQQFLEMLGGWRRDRTSGVEGLTVAGLLMFGTEQSIRAPEAVPQYNIDYREHLSDTSKQRWTDRIWLDGLWAGNLFQFFQRVYPRLVDGLKIPFQFYDTTSPHSTETIQRHDETIVHEAVREAFVNTLIHADFRGQGGIVLQRFRDRLIFSNPGTLLVSLEQMLRGAVSECRNKSLQTMFTLIGYGEKAGSGIAKIFQGWQSQKWQLPNIQTSAQPDRVQITLSMVSLLPEEVLVALQQKHQIDCSRLSSDEVQALVTAYLEGEVRNQRLQQLSLQHRTEITKILQVLVAKGFLLKQGHGRGATYRLPPAADSSSPHNDLSSPHNDLSSPHNDLSSPHNDLSSPHNDLSSPHNDPSSPHNAATLAADLLAIAAPARAKRRLSAIEIETIILRLCEKKYLTAHEIAVLLDRKLKNLRDRHLTPLSEAGRLVRRSPKPNDPNQAYRTTPKT